MSTETQTRVYGILGWPVAHSRSPAMHNAGFRALGLPAMYVPFAVTPDKLGHAVEGLEALGISGVNVTLPHKLAIMRWLDEVDPDARAIGAVNTVVISGKRRLGYNTDAPGMVRALREAGVTLVGANVTVLGAGGAARAAVVGLARAGVAKVAVAARRLAQAEALVGELSRVAPRTKMVAVAMADGLAPIFAESQLVVHATSATLNDSSDGHALCQILPFDALPRSAVVTDLVYQPRRTIVLRAAEARGLGTIDGLGMLLYQGVLAFEQWTGRTAPVEIMRAALEQG